MHEDKRAARTKDKREDQIACLLTHPAMRTSMCVSAASQQTCISVDMSCVAWVSWARSQSRVSSTTLRVKSVQAHHPFDRSTRGREDRSRTTDQQQQHIEVRRNASCATQQGGGGGYP